MNFYKTLLEVEIGHFDKTKQSPNKLQIAELASWNSSSLPPQLYTSYILEPELFTWKLYQFIVEERKRCSTFTHLNVE
jgi:hypothetical protein